MMMHKFQLGEKVGDKHIDAIISSVYDVLRSGKRPTVFIFDFSQIQWISNQELLVLTGLFKYMRLSSVQFFIQFRPEANGEVDARNAAQVVQIWETWKIYQVVNDKEFGSYFDIDAGYIAFLKTKFRIRASAQEIYERYGVTPFLSMERIQRYDDRRIGKIIDKIYALNDATHEILEKHNCLVPIQNRTLSAIITKELYENFLDHFEPAAFKAESDFAFMSLSLRRKFDTAKLSEKKIQDLLKLNFESEFQKEFKPFFATKKGFRNQSYLELSFMDFGKGIAGTLANRYQQTQPKYFSKDHYKQTTDTRVLEYAFRFDSSQDPIEDRYADHLVLPRGLFDLLSIVKRFEGLLIARSNFGKIAFDFSDGKSFEQAVIYFGNPALFFPGTLISVYLPERTLTAPFDNSKIKPIAHTERYQYADLKTIFISVNEIQAQLKKKMLPKKDFYNGVLQEIQRLIDQDAGLKLVYIDFEGYEIDERVSKKLIYFLVSDYRINLQCNVIVINPPDRAYLENIHSELAALSEIDKRFKIHPTPFIFFDAEEEKLSVFWLGVFLDADIRKLNQLLFDQHDLRSSEFEDPEAVVGNVNYYDAHGNLKSYLNSDSIVKLYQERIEASKNKQYASFLEKHLRTEENSIYLCNGNYYQKTYVQLFDALSNPDECYFLARGLFEKLMVTVQSLGAIKFLSITASSAKLLRAMIELGFIAESSTVILDNYHGFVDEQEFSEKVNTNDQIILVCDVISTGFMVEQLEKNLQLREASLQGVAVLVNAIDIAFDKERFNYPVLLKKICALIEFPIKKFNRSEIAPQLVNRTLKVIRVNPFTNTPINESVARSNYGDSVLLTNREFVDNVDEAEIRVGYYKFNNLLHPYFFATKQILQDDAAALQILQLAFKRIPDLKTEKLDVIFYPKNSGIRYLNFQQLMDKVLLNQQVKFFELERFSTSEGWRFPQPPDFMRRDTAGKQVLILDDGSCTGDSIIQMVDEVAFLEVGQITVLSMIGRVNDHKREFLSRLSSMNAGQKTIPLKICFATHWNIPTYYNEDSPVVHERRWLEQLIEFKNTPSRIRKIARVVQDVLTPKDVTTEISKHLLKDRQGRSISRELVLVREEVGKITSYRFYSSHFKFFDEVVAKYESQVASESRYQTIELICAVFLHEPYLFDRFRNVVPDVVDKIEEFVFALTFGNPRRGNRKIQRADLHYDWTNKDIIHLFFIVFRDTKLFSVLDSDKIVTLSDQLGVQVTDLNYILFKLVRYMPLEENLIETSRFSSRVIQLVEALKQKFQDGARKKQLKIFSSFLSTLPYSTDDFTSHVGKIKSNYDKLKEDDHHNDYIFNDKQILVTQLRVLDKSKAEGSVMADVLISIATHWTHISVFVEELLRFTSLYPGFLLLYEDKINPEFKNDPSCLRELHGRLQEALYSDDIENGEEIIASLNTLFDTYIMSPSVYPRIFQDIYTQNVSELYEAFKEGVARKYPAVKLQAGSVPNCAVDLPLVFSRDVVFAELTENFRHADQDHPIEITCTLEGEQLLFTVRNRIKNDAERRGGGKGTERLNRLNDFPSASGYSAKATDTEYIQLIKLKKI